MKGLIIFLMIFSHIISLTLSDAVLEDADKNVENTKTDTNHRRLPLFPKNNLKFYVSPEPVNRLEHHRHYDHTRTKMTLMPHFTPKYKTEPTIATTQRASRKPLMKLRTFTIESQVNGKFHGIKNEMIQKGYKTEATRVPKTNVYNQHKNHAHVNVNNSPKENENVSQLELPKSAETFPSIEDSKETEPIKVMKGEEEDRKEFIFLEESDEKNVNLEYGEDIEMTTDYVTTTRKSRAKRNENIIVEENMASTHSSLLKYTGKDTTLNNRFYFKNINS